MASVRPVFGKRGVTGKRLRKHIPGPLVRSSPDADESLNLRLMNEGDALHDHRFDVRDASKQVMPMQAALAQSESGLRTSFSPGSSRMSVYRKRWSWAPVVVRGTVSETAFHHFLHGAGGRPDERRRPLVAVGAVSSQAASAASRHAMRALPAIGPDSTDHFVKVEELGRSASVPTVPFVCSKLRFMEVAAPSGGALTKLRHADDEGAFEGCVATSVPVTLRVHQPRDAIDDALELEVERCGDESVRTDREVLERLRFAEVALNAGDIAYVPKALTYDLVPTTSGLQTGRAVPSQRRAGLLPTEIGIHPSPPLVPSMAAVSSEQRLHTVGSTSDTFAPFVAWRWRFKPFPELSVAARRGTSGSSGRPYVAAEHMVTVPRHLYR